VNVKRQQIQVRTLFKTQGTLPPHLGENCELGFHAPIGISEFSKHVLLIDNGIPARTKHVLLDDTPPIRLASVPGFEQVRFTT
jgi:hypothetical protein